MDNLIDDKPKLLVINSLKDINREYEDVSSVYFTATYC
jgi:hypothetical protein